VWHSAGFHPAKERRGRSEGNRCHTPRETDTTEPTDNPDAIIPVAEIHAPILLNCAAADQVWTSCAFADAIETELDAAHHAFPHPLYTYPAAGHGVGGLIPYEPPIVNEVDDGECVVSSVGKRSPPTLRPSQTCGHTC